MEDVIAHLAEEVQVHGLGEHLRGTAELAAEFAEKFGCAGWGRLARYWQEGTIL